jgi:hypothetical protein
MPRRGFCPQGYTPKKRPYKCCATCLELLDKGDTACGCGVKMRIVSLDSIEAQDFVSVRSDARGAWLKRLEVRRIRPLFNS